jgi:hypothetical protein
MTSTDFDFNVGTNEQRSVIPEGAICVRQMMITPGNAGDGGWLTQAKDRSSENLNVEFIVVDGPHAKQKFRQHFTMRGTTDGHQKAGEISRNTRRAILESARSIKPNDTSAAAMEARKVSGWDDFQNLRFTARVGVEPPANGYSAKNRIDEVLTPGHGAGWRKVDQIPSVATAPTPAAQALDKPEWAK